MNLHVAPTSIESNHAAADLLCRWLTAPSTRSIMVAAGNTPLELYRLVAERRPALAHLRVFALDEYVGVPLEEPRNCANLLRRAVADAWGIPRDRFHAVSSLASDAESSIRAHEARIAEAGGLDVIVLGLGQNGHLGFNEPGSAADSGGRLLDLEPISVEANRTWFGGVHAPRQGVTVGLRTILAARKAMILAFGPHKRTAVHAMLRGPTGPGCPASFLRDHHDTHVFLDTAAAERLRESNP
ncbi:MAG: glucosamine-6-phosphate deaminase [Verrucomicrobiales bacterium]|nr:glucosamine-6-phosphate deaminase [Verrucomicrobiales bacterium]